VGFTVIPAMHLANLDDALVIGLGSGHSAGMLKYVGFPSIDIAEFAPGIVTAARRHFSGLNKGILDARETSVYVEDGRNLLMTRMKRYDLISIEISSVWFSGATNVYSQGFYQTARQRLKPRGMLQQWVQLHHISPSEVESIIGTVRSVFPYVSLWISGGQGIILASDHRHGFEERGSDAVRRALLIELGGDEAAASRAFEELRRSVVMECDDVDQMMREAQPRINTDWNRYLEYATPRYNLSDANWPRINREQLARYSSAARSARAVTYTGSR
jgi:spermidine synthase